MVQWQKLGCWWWRRDNDDDDDVHDDDDDDDAQLETTAESPCNNQTHDGAMTETRMFMMTTR